MFSKSANLLDLQQKSTIRAIFKAKSVDLKTYSPSSYYIPGQLVQDEKENSEVSKLNAQKKTGCC